MKSFRLLLILSALASVGVAARAADSAVKLTRLDDRVRVEVGGQLFTEYIFKGASRPYCYPILAPDGMPLTRDFPMKATPGEDVDHKHHRALMFAHSDVNKIDFWNEGTSGTKFPKGNTVHDGLVETSSGKVGVIRTKNRWESPDGKLIATDETTLRFRAAGDTRMIDYEVTIHATPAAPLVMGDNKDGTMAIRVPQWMTLPHKNQVSAGAGHIVTAKGDRDAKAWGTRADWCDYFAEKNGKTYGIALFDHPQNLRHPTWWMARDYGLFTANPFGQHDFEGTKEKPLPANIGDHTIPAGGTLTLKYRFYFHSGDEQAGQVAARYAEYAAGK
ncbi:MAG: PmoA family protein [Verrucomicrobia bacterium]|nr:PmoA family protein [Verrucomicrobiota bacterium]